MSGTKSVVDVDVTELGEAGTELLDLLGVSLDLLAGLVGTLALLSTWYRRFSRRKILPLEAEETAFSVSGPTQSEGLDVLAEHAWEDLGGDGLERVLGHSLAIGTAHVRHEDDGLGLLLDGILDGRESSNDTLVVGDLVAVHGTLKSTRISTFLSLRSTSVMPSLLERDILLYCRGRDD